MSYAWWMMESGMTIGGPLYSKEVLVSIVSIEISVSKLVLTEFVLTIFCYPLNLFNFENRIFG